MAEQKVELDLNLTLVELKTAINNEENAGFRLKRLSISSDSEVNLLVVEGGPPVPSTEAIDIKSLETQDQTVAAQKVRDLHDALPADGGVVAWGKVSLDTGLTWVAAFRTAGMQIPVPTGGSVADDGLITKAVKIAKDEWKWFGKQEYDTSGTEIKSGKDEKDDDASERIRQYWTDGLGITNRTGKDDIAWSAAFISFILKKAGLTKSQFPFSEGHRVYINAAVKARNEGNESSAYWGYELDEYKPQVGDLICSWYKGKVTYDMAEQGKSYYSHCDLVISNDGNSIAAIGGNVGGSVTQKNLRLNEGFLTENHFSNGFAILGFRFGQAKSVPVKFSIDTNLKTTPSPLTEASIRYFLENLPDNRDSLKDIAASVIAAASKYSINATYILAHAIHESDWGRSNIAQQKHNLFGWNAVDDNPSQATSFGSRAECIDIVIGRINELYLNPDGKYYRQAPVLGDKEHGMNVEYASDPKWGEKIASIAHQIESGI